MLDRSPVVLPAPDELRRSRSLEGPWTTPVVTVAAVLAPPAMAAALVAIGGQGHQPVAALMMAALVVGIASTGRRGATVIAALCATASFDYFFVVPYHSFAVHQFDDVMTLLALLVVGAIAVLLRTKAERHRDHAEDGRNDLARIHAVNELVAEGRTPEYIVEIVRIELLDLLSLRDCTFDRVPPRTDVPHIERTGNVVIGELSWGVHQHGFPNGTVELPVSSLGVDVGRYVLTPTPGVPVSFDKRIVAVALADQVGAAYALSLSL